MASDNTDPRGEGPDKLPEDVISGLEGDDAVEVLKRYAEALQQEYANSVEAKPDDVQKLTKEFFGRKAHSAAAQIAYLADHADSETVRLNANKFILTEAFKEAEAAADPLSAILKGLTKNDATSPAPQED